MELREPTTFVEHVRVSLKVNEFCAIACNKVVIIIVEQTINGSISLDMVTEWLLPWIQQGSKNFIRQLDGTLPNYHLIVKAELNNRLRENWSSALVLLNWPPKSPATTPCDLFLMEMYHR